MKTALEAIKRAWVLFQIRALEATLDGQNKALSVIDCPVTCWKLEARRMRTKRRIKSLRSQYSNTLPPGRMVTWRVA